MKCNKIENNYILFFISYCLHIENKNRIFDVICYYIIINTIIIQQLYKLYTIIMNSIYCVAMILMLKTSYL